MAAAHRAELPADRDRRRDRGEPFRQRDFLDWQGHGISRARRGRPHRRRSRGKTPGPDAAALEHLAGVHQSLRVESALQRAHQLELERRLAAADRFALELPQPMLGGNRAAQLGDRVVHDAAYRLALREERVRADVVVQVAVADMAEHVLLHAGERALERARDALDQLWGLRYRHGDVVLDGRELRLGNALPDAPQRARMRAALRERRAGERDALADAT